jgi:hypothetical protein
MGMKLYHFTAARFLDSIMENGVTKGKIPEIKSGLFSFKTGYQWLTKSEEFRQEWCLPEYSTLPYDRSEIKLTIEIPKLRQKNLKKWLSICKYNELADTLNSEGDPENWFVYKGTIFPQWIKKIERKEKPPKTNFGGF